MTYLEGQSAPTDSFPDATDNPGEPESRWNGRVSITVTLATAIGLLVVVSVGVVLGVGVWLAQKNTFALLSENADQGVSAAVDRIRQHLRPAEHQARFLAERIMRGEVDPADRERFAPMLTGALAAAPQIEAVMFIDPGLQALVAGFDRASGDVALAVADYSRDPIISNSMRDVRSGMTWARPIWREEFQKTYLNLAYPVVRDDTFIGAVVAVVSVRELSDFVAGVAAPEAGRQFVLYGRDRVLAHSLLAEGYPGRSATEPLPRLAEFGDPVLAAIWRRAGRHELHMKLPQGTDGHVLDTDDDRYVFVAYFRAADVGEEVRRMIVSLVAGVVVLIVSLAAAVFIGRRMANPIVRFSAAASQIRDLDISKVESLPGSVFRELNDQSAAFNAMLRALRWFELYVPRKIVERLVKQGDVRETVSDDREIAVMFTDIVGFSTISQGMSAPEVAAFVNQHFALVAGAIEAEDGTVDKFIGDSVMAFWGAPERQEGRAERACRAALAIAAAIRDDNRLRAAAGRPPVGIRIGIHSGHVTVGNIGAPGRLNYTIIGDAVNIGQRLEQLGKEVYPAGTDVAILISGDTARDLGPDFKPIAAGRHKLKGRVGEVEVFRLI
jgi:class 3 adenylate cyclase